MKGERLSIKRPARNGVSDHAFNSFLDCALAILYERRAELNRAIRALQYSARDHAVKGGLAQRLKVS
jgi:hypothetical protein